MKATLQEMYQESVHCLWSVKYLTKALAMTEASPYLI